MGKVKAKKLKKDLVIPAGTVFAKCKRFPSCEFYEAIIGVSKDTYGVVQYFFDDSDNDNEDYNDDKELSEWFEDVEE